jgi:hypothetical protein
MEERKRSRGRPAIPDNERTSVVPVRLRAETLAALDEIAGEGNRSTLAREIIERHVSRAARKVESQKARK